MVVGLHLSYRKSKDNGKDNYYNSNLSDSPILPQRDESSDDDDGNDDKNNNNNDKALARLLVVDDDADIAQVLKIGLQKNRFLVNAFTNPEEALQSFQSSSK